MGSPAPIGTDQRSSLVSSLFLAAATVALCLLTLECGLRVLGYFPESYRQTDRAANGRRTILLDCYPSNPRGYFDIDLRDPEVRARYRRMGVARLDEVASRTPFCLERRLNSLRFRGAETPPRRPGVVRVAVIGDSFTEGMGVKEEDAYPVVLGRLAGPASDGEVINCGRRGYEIPAIYDMFVTDVLSLQPDLVVYGMVLNDPDRSTALDAFDKHWNDWIMDRRRMDTAPPAAPGPFDSRTFAFVRDRLRARSVARATTQWYADLYGEANREGWMRTEQLIRDMNGQMRARGGRFAVALWPLLIDFRARYPFEAQEQKIERFCLESGIPFHNLRAAFNGRAVEALWVHPVDHHPNEVGHRIAAESLLPRVREWTRP